MRRLWLILALALLPLALFGETIPVEVNLPAGTDEFLALLFKSLGEFKGLSRMGIALVLVQLTIVFLRTPMANLAGAWRLTLVTGLSLAYGVLGLLSSGVSWQAALLHSSTLAMVQVFAHQVLKQAGKIPQDVENKGKV